MTHPTDIADRLNEEFRRQEFSDPQPGDDALGRGRRLAEGYADMERAVAVLSDMLSDMSYIYYGRFARTLGLGPYADADTDTDTVLEGGQRICSIWEREVFSRIHPDDLQRKHLQELRFFHFVKRQHRSRRADFYMAGRLRMRSSRGEYVNVLHRIFYIPERARNTLRLALCLYTPLVCDIPDAGMIIDAAEGTVIALDSSTGQRILSPREREILRLIDNGLPSKEIAQRLSISIHTVSRHRQQILGKLRVKNSIEACRTAKSLHLI